MTVSRDLEPSINGVDFEAFEGLVAASPKVKLSVNQARLMAEHLGLGASGWRRISAAWSHAMARGTPVDPEHLKPLGLSQLDGPEERAARARLQDTSDRQT